MGYDEQEKYTKELHCFCRMKLRECLKIPAGHSQEPKKAVWNNQSMATETLLVHAKVHGPTCQYLCVHWLNDNTTVIEPIQSLYSQEWYTSILPLFAHAIAWGKERC